MTETGRPTLTAVRQGLAAFMWTGPWAKVNVDEMNSDEYCLIETRLEDAIAETCKVLGHEWENDQCGIPTHRFCLYCQAPITARALEEGS